MDGMEQLLSLLRSCTVQISGAGERGTGFFVAPSLILTCAHVVENAQRRQSAVAVAWEEQSYTAQIEHFLAKPYPDLALLRAENLPPHPCVFLHEEVNVDDDLSSYGYTDTYPDGEPATFVFEGPTGKSQVLLKFKFGEVRAGLSGGPLLNRRTGGVCGVVKRTRGVDTAMGGRAIPVSVITQRFPEVVAHQKEFPQQNKRWYECLTLQQRQLLGLASTEEPTDAIKVFYSYASEDENLARELQKQLITLKRQNLITEWYPSKIVPGAVPEEQFVSHLKTAQVILLLVSPDYMYSEVYGNVQVQLAMERLTSGAIVVPIKLRDIDNWDATAFGKLQAIPRNGKPVAAWRNRDAAFAEVAKEIRSVIERLREKTSL